MKTLLLRDYIVEHDIDLFAITETWLTDDSLDEFYCRDISPEGITLSSYQGIMLTVVELL